MKKVCLLLLAFAICNTTFAQNFLGMKIKKFGISSTVDQDRLQGLDASYFDGLSKDGISAEVMENDFDPVDIISMTCENPALRAEITVLPFRTSPNIQLNMGTGIMFNRIESTGYGFYNSNLNSNEYYRFRSYSHEAALDGSLVYNLKLWAFNLYGGAGTNLGYTFDGDLDIEGHYWNENGETFPGSDGGQTSEGEFVSFYESHDMKNSLHQRVFLHGGVSIIFFKRLEVGLEGRRGVGYRYNTGNPLKFTDLVSAGFNVKWNLK